MNTQDLEEKIACFWHRPHEVPGASVEELDAAERRIGFPIPNELRQLLQFRDGGVSNYDLFGEILFAPVRGVANKAGTGDMAELYVRGGVSELPAGAVIFAADANAWFALDYRVPGKEAGVIYWSECEESPVQLTTTFREFLERLSSE